MNIEREILKCRSKASYETKELAVQEGKLFFGYYSSFNVYHCPYCGAWHLTSQNSWK